MLQGRSELSLDIKGRMSIPTRYRPDLVDPDTGRSVVTITVHPDDFLILYPVPVWHRIAQQLLDLPDTERDLKRRMIGFAVDVELDGSGRILVPPELRAEGRLDTEVTLVGMGHSLELWPRAELKARDMQEKAKLKTVDLSRISL